MKKGIIFDLDGTLWDSSKEVADSWMLALKDCPDIKREITTEDLQNVMGKVMDEIADILFAEVSKERRTEVLNHCMQVENEYILQHGGQLMEGLEDTLKILKQKYHLYIVSNCQVGYIEAFLEYHKLGEYFEDFESYGGTGMLKAKNIQLVVKRNRLDRAVYVGDTQGDYDSAMEAGLPFIHAKTGYGVLNAKTLFITKFSQLPEIVSKVLEQ